MSKYAKMVQPVPQSEALDERQVENNAGGFVYQITDWQRLERFLILGSDAPTYYQQAPKLTRENAQCVERCWNDNPHRTADAILSVSQEGRAPKNDSAIFALAIGALNAVVETRQIAFGLVNLICRTATHFFMFRKFRKALGGGNGRGYVRVMANWYDEKPIDKLAYQVVKYREREGYNHSRMLKCGRPPGDKITRSAEGAYTCTTDEERGYLYRWIVGKPVETKLLPPMVQGYIAAKDCLKVKPLVALINDYGLPWEALPNWSLTEPKIWKALLPTTQMHALMRNLGRLARLEVTKPLSMDEAAVAARFEDTKALKESRLHPYSILVANRTYGSGHGFRGKETWTPSNMIVDALDSAFYKAFKNVKPTGKRLLLAIDISGSMGSSFGDSLLTCREAAAAMSLVTLATEKRTHVVGFHGEGHRGTIFWHHQHGPSLALEMDATGGKPYKNVLLPLAISPNMRLNDVVDYIAGLSFGPTDCSLPMLYAMDNNLEVDAFVVYTDNETWCGEVHPTQALRDYRRKTGINAKLIVVGITSTGFSIADPNDPGMLDVVGFDANGPALISEFIKGGE